MDAPAPAPADHPPSPPVQSPLPPFKLERFFAKYEFHPTCTHHLCCSDAEPFTLEALLGVADADSLARYNSLSLAYTETAGLPALREAIAAQYTTLSAAEIVVAAPQELIFLAMTALLQPGDRIACTFPGYQSLFQVAKCVGCEVDLWEPRCDDKGQQWFDPQDLAALVQRGPLKVVVTNFPHNPTGFLPTTTQWQQIVHTCAGAGAELFSDEMQVGRGRCAWLHGCILQSSSWWEKCLFQQQLHREYVGLPLPSFAGTVAWRWTRLAACLQLPMPLPSASPLVVCPKPWGCLACALVGWPPPTPPCSLE